MIADSKS